MARPDPERRERPEPPELWLTHYPRMLAAYLRHGEDGLSELEDELRARAAGRPGGKFGKGEAAYVPFVPLPPLEWRHRCGHCRFWVDQGPGEAGQCMIVGREGDRWGGKDVHEKAGCALFVPPAGERAFDWLREQTDPTGADLVRGEFHASGDDVQIPVGESGGGEREPATERPTGRRRYSTKWDVGTAAAPAGTTVGLEPVATGLTAPVDCAVDGDRLLVADQVGLVRVVADGLRDEPLLDLRERTVDLRTQYDERGLLGLALHPDDDRLFVRYSAPPRAGTPDDHDHTEVLAEFPLDGDRSPVDPGAERALMEIPHPRFNHNAGAVAFGPDGYLYVPMGDGGGEGDAGFGHVPGGNAQDVTRNVLGSIMRIDVDADVDESPEWTGNADADPRGDEPYGVPDDNPLVGEDALLAGDNDPADGDDALTDGEGIDELYAWGLRNPWSMSFDSEGRLFVADVGQALFEEVNLVEAGGNYGWPIREGFHCFDPENPNDPPAGCPGESVRGEPLLEPILEYPHVAGGDVVGSAVTGGAVYEAEDVDPLTGKYVFGDWAATQDRPSGRLFAATPGPDGGPWGMEELVVAGSDNGRPNRNVLGFGQAPDGVLYLLSSETHAPTGKTGAVHRFVAPE